MDHGREAEVCVVAAGEEAVGEVGRVDHGGDDEGGGGEFGWHVGVVVGVAEEELAEPIPWVFRVSGRWGGVVRRCHGVVDVVDFVDGVLAVAIRW